MRFFLLMGVILPLILGLTIRQPSFEELVKEATWIVRAKVISNRLITSPRLPFSLLRTRFKVLKTWKGSIKTTIFIQLLASKSGQKHLKLPQIPRFKPSEEVFLFLRSSSHSRYPLLVALYFGVFDIFQRKGVWFVRNRGRLGFVWRLAQFRILLRRKIVQQAALERRRSWERGK